MNDHFGSSSCSVMDRESPLADDVVEIPLLLSARQMSALETAAHDHGLSAAEMVRTVLSRFLRQQTRH